MVIGGTVVDRNEPPEEAAEVQAEAREEDEGSDEDGRPGPLAPGATAHYGAEFTIDGEAMPLATALSECAGTGERCLVRGTVDRVCQVSGCWFTVAAPDVEAVVRIVMLDYAFFVPANVAGAEAIFEGTLELLEVPQERAQHYADDEAAAGGEARVVDGPELTYKFTIAGVRVTMPAE